MEWSISVSALRLLDDHAPQDRICTNELHKRDNHEITISRERKTSVAVQGYSNRQKQGKQHQSEVLDMTR